MRVLSMLPDVVAAHRLRAATKPARPSDRVYDVHPVTDWGAFLTAATLRRPFLAVIDPFTTSQSPVEDCARFVRTHPTIGLIVYARFDASRVPDLVALARLPRCEVLVRDLEDSPDAIRLRLGNCVARRLSELVMCAAGEMVPPSAHALLEYLIVNCRTSITPDQVARSQFCHAKTVRERLRRWGLPSLNRLIVWVRVLEAVHVIAAHECSVRRTAAMLGYSSESALRVQLRRYTGLSGMDLRKPEAPRIALARFRDECRRRSPVHAVRAD